MDDDAARERLLDAAEGLFYARGIQAVGMDAVREASGLPLKRLYALYPGKAALVEAVLDAPRRALARPADGPRHGGGRPP